MIVYSGLASIHLLMPMFLVAGWAGHATRLYQRLNRVRRDPLTGLLTRDGWSRAAERIISRHPGAVIILGDLNAFKPVNDDHGHDAGDAVLAEVGQRLTHWCGRHGVPGRLGGDEFVAVLRDGGQDWAQRLAQLEQLVSEPVTHEDLTLKVGISLGFAHVADLEEASLHAALKAADRAMYRAKGGRRGRRPQLPAPLGVVRVQRLHLRQQLVAV
jgi:diguanylate cyclase (GGDEF)-like protein